MIIIARLGGIEILADDEMTETRPTPECIGDTAKRLAEIALDTYIALPEGTKAAVTEDDD